MDIDKKRMLDLFIFNWTLIGPVRKHKVSSDGLMRAQYWDSGDRELPTEYWPAMFYLFQLKNTSMHRFTTAISPNPTKNAFTYTSSIT